MPYTLAKFLLWGLLMAVAGGVIGWLLHSLTARARIAAVRATTVDADELERLRGRLANLEPVVAERDRLRMELADVRGSTAGALGFAAVAEEPIIPHEELSAPLYEPAPVGHTTSGTAGPELDVERARIVLGRKIVADDLTVVEGIGPKVAELCAAMGITTWRQLADTDVARLQSMLNDAGSRFRTHKPGTWPRQAALLADGSWDEFKRLVDELGGGT